jgi:hypothetical protein
MIPSEISSVLTTFSEMAESLQKESDRGCVLVVGALLENVLEEHITARLIPKANKDDELMSRSNNSPINSFSAKINLAYRVGLIAANERKIYHQLRELRNVCAHQIEQQDFDKLHFRDRIKNIMRESDFVWETLMKKVTPSLFPEGGPQSVEGFVDAIGWRRAFEVFFSMIIAHKKICILRVIPIAPLANP